MARGDFVLDILQGLFVAYLSPRQIREVAGAATAMLPALSLPSPNESAALTLTRPKLASLCFDRVWAGANAQEVPEAIRFWGDTDLEVGIVILNALGNAAESGERPKSAWTFNVSGLAASLEDSEFAHDELLSPPAMTRSFCAELHKRHGLELPGIYSSQSQYMAEYCPGQKEALVAVLDGLVLVDEDATEWEQVMEFRRDSQARKKYAQMVHWLDGNMVGKPVTFIQDEISQRIENYNWAIRKHGFNTVLGALATTLDARSLFKAGAAYAAVSMLTTDTLAALAGGGLLISSAAVHVARELLNLEDLRRNTHPEVAYVYEAKKLSPRDAT